MSDFHFENNSQSFASLPMQNQDDFEQFDFENEPSLYEPETFKDTKKSTDRVNSIPTRLPRTTLNEMFEYFRQLEGDLVPTQPARMVIPGHLVDMIATSEPSKTFCLYKQLVDIGIYLPPFKTKTISFNYLCGVAINRYFFLRNGEVKFYAGRMTFTIAELLTQIVAYVGVNLGYNSQTAPSRQYLANILYTCDPQNFMFGGPIVRVNLPKVSVINNEPMFEVPETIRGLVRYDVGIVPPEERKEQIYRNRLISKAHKYGGVIKKHIGLLRKIVQKTPGLKLTQEADDLLRMFN